MYRQLCLCNCLALGVLLAGAGWAADKAKDKPSPDTPQSDLKLDHFKFYAVKPVDTKFDCGVRGQFDEDIVPVRLPAIVKFANPVAKDRGVIIDPNAHLTWYKLLQRLAEPKRKLRILNQFGKQELLIGMPVGLLVPTEKIEKGSKLPRLDHYKVYRVLESRPFERTVVLKDQFGAEPKVRIGKTMFFCVPVMKEHKETCPIINEKAHITIYAIEPMKQYGLEKPVRDQFGKRKLSIEKSEMLGVPTSKLVCTVVK